MWQPFANGRPRLAVLAECASTGHNDLLLIGSHTRQALPHAHRCWKFGSGMFYKIWFVVE
jgi:hypothetical protein